jgi:serine/threonine protein kinase
MATSDRPHVDILGPTIPLFYQRHDDALKKTAACFFGAAKNAIRSLKNYYEIELPRLLVHKSIVPPDPRFPYPNCYRSLDNPDLLQYIRYTGKYVEPGAGEWNINRRLLYFAVTVEETPKNLCIKFVRRYGKEAHQQCARRQIAPAMYGFDTLDGGWYMVVMEAIDLQKYILLCDMRLQDEQRSRIRDKLLDCLRFLHNDGMVHGDIRDTNLFVSPDDDDIKLNDFDWAGQFGEVRYPMTVNRSTVKRPATVFDGELVTSEHDCYMLDLILPN